MPTDTTTSEIKNDVMQKDFAAVKMSILKNLLGIIMFCMI